MQSQEDNWSNYSNGFLQIQFFSKVKTKKKIRSRVLAPAAFTELKKKKTLLAIFGGKCIILDQDLKREDMCSKLTAGRTGGVLASDMGVNIFPVRPVFPQHQQLSCSFTSLVTGCILCVFALVPPPTDCEGDGPPGGYGSRESILRPEAKRIRKRQRHYHRYG